MGADIKSLRVRIKSVNSTLHLTKAMGLVASSKIKRATDGMLKGREYSDAVSKTVELLTGLNECKKSPYMQVRNSGRTRMVVIAGDRGLAGGYNANIFRLMREYPDATVYPIGKRACDRFGGETVLTEGYTYDNAIALSKTLCEDFKNGEFDRLAIVSTKYVSMLVGEPTVEFVLPLNADNSEKVNGAIFEPDELTVLNTAVPEYIAGKIVAAARESFACEIAARRTAMDAAGKNAQEMIDELQLKYNRARQSSITQEITEIVAGGSQ